MTIQNISQCIKRKLNIFTPLSIFILIIISFLVVSLVKHQEITIEHQVLKVEIAGKDWTNNHNQFDGYRPPNWLVEDIYIGAQEFSPDGRVVAEIIDIDYFERNGGNAQVVLTIQVESVANFSSGRTIYKGKNIEIGEKVDFHFDNTFILGQIIDIFDVGYVEIPTEIIIKGKFKSVPVEVANKIEPGMEVINPFNSKIYARIENKRVLQSFQSVFSQNPYTLNNYFKIDYSLKDVELEVLLNVEERLGNYYYSGHQVIKVGENLSLFFPELNVNSMLITDVVIPKKTTE